ncbi:hypothetical protein ACWGOQ_0006175 [Aquimarina sp. M1]
MENKAFDPFTNQEFTKNRSNQKYKSRENQIKFNNEKARKKRMAMAAINKALENNRKVLHSILGDNERVKRSKDFMLGAGYAFGVFTHHMMMDESLWHCVYEYGITKLEHENYIIRKTS